jgi:coenzyme Q-binding protein COQ10
MLAAIRQGAAAAPRLLLPEAAPALAAALRAPPAAAAPAWRAADPAPSPSTSTSPPAAARGFLSLPGFDGTGAAARCHHERRLFGYAPKEFFDVVADVDAYSLFVPWCVRSAVARRAPAAAGGASGGHLEAELEVGFQMFVEKYTSIVELSPESSPMVITSRTGDDSALFSRLDARWEFAPGPAARSAWVTFELDFAFKSPLYAKVADLFFEEVVTRMLGAFEGRCRELHGPPAAPLVR